MWHFFILLLYLRLVYRCTLPVRCCPGNRSSTGQGSKRNLKVKKTRSARRILDQASGRTGSNREFGLLFHGETFKLEYLVYISAVMILVGLCCYQVRVLGHASRLAAMVRRPGKEESAMEKPGSTGSTDQLNQANEVFQSEITVSDINNVFINTSEKREETLGEYSFQKGSHLIYRSITFFIYLAISRPTASGVI